MHQDNQHDLRARGKRLADACVSRWHRYCYEKAPPTLSTTPHFLLRKKTLFTLAVVVILVGAILRPVSFLFLLWSPRFITVVVAGSLLGVLARETAAVYLGTKGRLWYTRRMAPVFLVVTLATMQTLLPVADRLVARMLGIGPFFASGAAAYVLLGMELIAIALLR